MVEARHGQCPGHWCRPGRGRLPRGARPAAAAAEAEAAAEALDEAPEIELNEEEIEPAVVADDVHARPEYPADDLHHEPGPKLRKMTFQFADAAPEPT